MPVIGKADTLTPEELSVFKKQIMKQIDDSQIHLYQFPQECEINAKLPFAVVGSNCVLDINGEKIRGRRYPWGVVNVSKLYWKNTFSFLIIHYIHFFFYLLHIFLNFRLMSSLFLGSGCKLSDPLSGRKANAKSSGKSTKMSHFFIFFQIFE